MSYVDANPSPDLVSSLSPRHMANVHRDADVHKQCYGNVFCCGDLASGVVAGGCLGNWQQCAAAERVAN